MAEDASSEQAEALKIAPQLSCVFVSLSSQQNLTASSTQPEYTGL